MDKIKRLVFGKAAAPTGMAALKARREGGPPQGGGGSNKAKDEFTVSRDSVSSKGIILISGVLFFFGTLSLASSSHYGSEVWQQNRNK